jgi:hypothetical protein
VPRVRDALLPCDDVPLLAWTLFPPDSSLYG